MIMRYLARTTLLCLAAVCTLAMGCGRPSAADGQLSFSGTWREIHEYHSQNGHLLRDVTEKEVTVDGDLFRISVQAPTTAGQKKGPSLCIFDGTHIIDETGRSQRPKDSEVRRERWWQVDVEDLVALAPLGSGEPIAGRSTAVRQRVEKGIKVTREVKLWLDTETGVILKKSIRWIRSGDAPDTDDWQCKDIHFGPVDRALFFKPQAIRQEKGR